MAGQDLLLSYNAPRKRSRALGLALQFIPGRTACVGLEKLVEPRSQRFVQCLGEREVDCLVGLAASLARNARECRERRQFVAMANELLEEDVYDVGQLGLGACALAA